MTLRFGRPTAAEDPYAAEERRRAARALLRTPLLTAEGPDADDFRLVRRHRDELRRLFADGLGYRMEVESRTARLFKAGIGRDASRPLLRRGDRKRPFSPRAYALLCLTIAALTRSKDQLLVDELVAQVRSAAADAQLDVDLDDYSDRRALHAALTALIEFGVLRERDQDGGGLERWAQDPKARSLLDVVRDRLRLLLARGLTGVTSPADLLETATLPSASGGARVAIRRRLVESPVLSVTDLTTEQADWWQKNRNREQERLREMFGLELELRAEGGLLIDPDGELSDVDFPGIGSTKHVALLVLERLAAACVKQNDGPVWRRVPPQALDAAITDVAGTYVTALTKQHRADPGSLRADVLGLLTSVGLIRSQPDGGCLVHAASARYAPRPVLAGPARQGSLFDAGEEV
jgi:uncharacterized protein (TIGR02678 family)